MLTNVKAGGIRCGEIFVLKTKLGSAATGDQWGSGQSPHGCSDFASFFQKDAFLGIV